MKNVLEKLRDPLGFFFLDLPSNFGNTRKDARMFVKIFVLFDIRVIRYVNSFIIR